MAKCASRSVVKGCRTRRGSPVLKLCTKPEIERPAILKTSRPGVPGRVEALRCSASIGTSRKRKERTLTHYTDSRLRKTRFTSASTKTRMRVQKLAHPSAKVQVRRQRQKCSNLERN